MPTERDGGRVLLASGSPRRLELLTQAGVDVEVWIPDVDEQPLPGEDPIGMVRRLATAKHASAVHIAGERCIVAADTAVVIDDDILGKPGDPAEARSMLRRICGASHVVVTGYAVGFAGAPFVGHAASRVTMRQATDDEIAGYVAGGEPLDKAGAYAAQGAGGELVDAIEGSRSNVIGLPMEHVLPLLGELGFSIPAR